MHLCILGPRVENSATSMDKCSSSAHPMLPPPTPQQGMGGGVELNSGILVRVAWIKPSSSWWIYLCNLTLAETYIYIWI
jgi:hypothetical protein